MKSENLKFLETSAPVQACNGIALLLVTKTVVDFVIKIDVSSKRAALINFQQFLHKETLN